MQALAVSLLGLLLLFTLLISVQIAAGFGELCGIRPGRDKSGLGGFTMLLVLFAIRWLGLAAGLATVAGPGETGWLLAAHAAIGVVSARSFELGVQRVQRDLTVPFLAGLIGSTLLPAPAWLLIVYRSLRGAIGETPAAAIGAVVVVLHAVVFRQRRAGMLATAA